MASGRSGPGAKTIDTPEVKAVLSDWDKQVAAFNPQKDLEARIKQDQDWVARMKATGREKEIPANRTPPSDLRPGPVMDMNKPGNCYASMLAPIAGFQIKGALRHRGPQPLGSRGNRSGIVIQECGHAKISR